MLQCSAPGLATLMASGSAPLIVLHGATMKRRVPFRQFHRYLPVYSLRVHWVPLFPSSQRLGAFAVSPHPGVHGFPVLRLRCPIRLSPVASRIREAFPPHYFPTALLIHRGVSRVRRGRLKRNDGGGVLLAAPSALCGSSVSLQGKTGGPGVPWPCSTWLRPLLWPRSNHFGPD